MTRLLLRRIFFCVQAASTLLVGIHAYAQQAPRTGSLVGWGYNEAGQTNVPAGNDFMAVAAGDLHGLALRMDGSLTACSFSQMARLWWQDE